MAEPERTGVALLFAYGLGVVRVKGLKLWPTSKSRVLAVLLHRGRLSAALETDRGARLPKLTGVAEELRGGVRPDDGEDSVETREATGLLVIWEGGAKPVVLRADVGCGSWLPVLLDRLLPP